MEAKVRVSSRWVVVAGLFVLGAMALDFSAFDGDSTMVANKWKVRPSAARNYRRFYRNSPPMGPMMPYYGEGEIQTVPEQQPAVAPQVPPEELPRRSG